MARIELKNCVIRMKDGFTGTAKVDDLSISGDDVTLEIDTLASLPGSLTIIPVGVRFTIDTVATTVFTVSATQANEQQLVTLDTPSAGDFTLTFDSEETAAIAYDAAASAVQTALELLANIDGPGVDIAVTGSAGGPYTVEFKGQYLATDVALMVIDGTGLTDAGAEAVTLVHAGATTWKLTFTPALDVADLPANDDIITLLPQQIDIKIGDGNVTYTESNEYEYDLDRDLLDSVRAGAEVPIDVSLDFVYEFIVTGTGEAISPMDALKMRGGAAEWRSSSSDPCEPYSIDIEIVHTPICVTAEIETTIFPDFRSESREVNIGDAAVSVSGRCNVTEPTITRTAQS